MYYTPVFFRVRNSQELTKTGVPFLCASQNAMHSKMWNFPPLLFHLSSATRAERRTRHHDLLKKIVSVFLANVLV